MTIIKRSGILEWTRENIDKVPDATGVYDLRSSPSGSDILYIGRNIAPRRLRERILDHWQEKDVPNVKHFAWYQTDTEENAKKIEDKWIEDIKPPHNIKQKQ